MEWYSHLGLGEYDDFDAVYIADFIWDGLWGEGVGGYNRFFATIALIKESSWQKNNVLETPNKKEQPQ